MPSQFVGTRQSVNSETLSSEVSTCTPINYHNYPFHSYPQPFYFNHVPHGFFPVPMDPSLINSGSFCKFPSIRNDSGCSGMSDFRTTPYELESGYEVRHGSEEKKSRNKLGVLGSHRSSKSRVQDKENTC